MSEVPLGEPIYDLTLLVCKAIDQVLDNVERGEWDRAERWARLLWSLADPYRELEDA